MLKCHGVLCQPGSRMTWQHPRSTSAAPQLVSPSTPAPDPPLSRDPPQALRCPLLLGRSLGPCILQPPGPCRRLFQGLSSVLGPAQCHAPVAAAAPAAAVGVPAPGAGAGGALGLLLLQQPGSPQGQKEPQRRRGAASQRMAPGAHSPQHCLCRCCCPSLPPWVLPLWPLGPWCRCKCACKAWLRPRPRLPRLLAAGIPGHDHCHVFHDHDPGQ